MLHTTHLYGNIIYKNTANNLEPVSKSIAFSAKKGETITTACYIPQGLDPIFKKDDVILADENVSYRHNTVAVQCLVTRNA